MVRIKTVLVLAGLILSSATLADTLSVEDFVRHALYSEVKISPSGEFLAVTVDRGAQDVLTVFRTADMKLLKVNQLPDKKSVGSFYWVGENRLMLNAVNKMGGDAQPLQTADGLAVNA